MNVGMMVRCTRDASLSLKHTPYDSDAGVAVSDVHAVRVDFPAGHV